MSNPADVKRVLARLASGESHDYPAVSTADDYRAVVDAAADAVGSLDDAGAFVDADGRERLAEAIATAEDAGDHAAARRGRQARDALDALRDALAGATEAGVDADHGDEQ